jgi:hypothetical protein
MNSLHRLNFNEIESKIPRGLDEKEMKKVGVNIAQELYDSLVPRWKAVVLTAVAELETEEKMTKVASSSSSLPWANMKFFGNPDRFGDFAKYGIPALGKSMRSSDQAKYKYLIDLGGGGGTTWSGTIQKLILPGLLFHHVTPTKDYIHDRMKPWIHYVPIAGDLHDLKEKYNWAEENPQVAKSISENGSKLMSHLISPEGMDEMYEQFIAEPAYRVIKAYQPVSITHPGLSWRDILKNLEVYNMELTWTCTGRLWGPNGLKAKCECLKARCEKYVE